MRYQLLFAYASLSLVRGQAFQVGRTVKTTSGKVTGKASSLYSGVSEYLGVPFAQPPVGPLRFAPPAAITDSSKNINATDFGLSCIEAASRASRANPKAPQNIGAAENQMDEDCLSLNIWV
jgi:cholinesterase